jgi:DNA-binding MarR family transcriptional regulator
MHTQEHTSEGLKLELDTLAREIRLFSGEMRHDTWLSIITTADAVNRYLIIKLRRARSHSTRYGILNALVTHEQSMTPTALSKAVFRSKYNVSRVVDKLERDGLVEKHSLSADRRVRKIDITPRGVNFIRETIPERRKIGEEVTSVLSRDEIATLRDILKRLRRHLNNLISKETTVRNLGAPDLRNSGSG